MAMLAIVNASAPFERGNFDCATRPMRFFVAGEET